MLETAINLIVLTLMFALAVWAILYICSHFQMPQPVLWICGALLLILVLLGLASVLNIGGIPPWRPIQVR